MPVPVWCARWRSRRARALAREGAGRFSKHSPAPRYFTLSAQGALRIRPIRPHSRIARFYRFLIPPTHTTDQTPSAPEEVHWALNCVSEDRSQYTPPTIPSPRTAGRARGAALAAGQEWSPPGGGCSNAGNVTSHRRILNGSCQSLQIG